jgi:nicotinamide-nucleotide amidase
VCKGKYLTYFRRLIEKYTAESMQVTVEMINKGKELLHADLYVAVQVFEKGGSETPENL